MESLESSSLPLIWLWLFDFILWDQWEISSQLSLDPLLLATPTPRYAPYLYTTKASCSSSRPQPTSATTDTIGGLVPYLEPGNLTKQKLCASCPALWKIKLKTKLFLNPENLSTKTVKKEKDSHYRISIKPGCEAIH